MVRIEIPGEPTGKGRPRMTRGGRVYTPKKTAEYERLIKTIALEQNIACSEHSIHLDITACFGIPKSKPKKVREQMALGEIACTKKPDLDNIVKIIGDALNDIAFRDDSQVISIHARKFYSDNPRVIVKIREVK